MGSVITGDRKIYYHKKRYYKRHFTFLLWDIFLPTYPSEKRKISLIELELENHLDLYHFQNCCLLPVFSPTSTLVFNLSCPLFSIFCCAHMHVDSHRNILVSAFERKCVFLFLTLCYPLIITHYKSNHLSAFCCNFLCREWYSILYVYHFYYTFIHW